MPVVRPVRERRHLPLAPLPSLFAPPPKGAPVVGGLRREVEPPRRPPRIVFGPIAWAVLWCVSVLGAGMGLAGLVLR